MLKILFLSYWFFQAWLPICYQYADKGKPGRRTNEKEYKCCPPPLFMIIISIIQVVLFNWNYINALIYNPYRRYEVWRYVTYIFVHNGIVHLVVNLLIQIVLGIPLEMLYKWWRVGIIYLAGVIVGSLGASITNPDVFLYGASGGVYAITTAYTAKLIMNWKQIKFAWLQIIVFIVFALLDIGQSVYYSYFLNLDNEISYACHFFGALAGLLVGLFILKNLEARSWKKKLALCAIVVYVMMVGTMIILNITWTSHFPNPRPY